MFKWLCDLRIKIVENFRKIHYRFTRRLNLRGIYFRKYCKEILDGTESRNESYEEILEKIRSHLKTNDGSEPTRIDAALYFYEFSKKMKS